MVLICRNWDNWNSSGFVHADDAAMGLNYLAIYAQELDLEKIAPTRDSMNKVLSRPDDPQNLLWWC